MKFPIVDKQLANQVSTVLNPVLRPTPTKIILDIFSGRKNPEFTIHMRLTEYMFNALGDALREVDLKESDHPYLGYRGFWISFIGTEMFYVPARGNKTETMSKTLKEDFLYLHGTALRSSGVLPEDQIKKILESL